MKNIKKISYAAALLAVTATVSCNKQLKEYNPHGSTVETIYNTPAGYLTLVNMAYQDLHQVYGIEDGFFLCETGTDLWFNEGRGGYAEGVTKYNGMGPDKPSQPGKHWNSCYKGINLCNMGLEIADKAGFVNETEKNQRLGELHFLRALYYYHIVEQFGGVTLLTASSLNGVVTSPTRSTPEQFYDVMIADLEFAKANLPVTWPLADYSRASKKSAAGLLARVLLTRAYYSEGSERNQWFTKAKDAAVDAINNAGSWGLSLYQTYTDIGQSVYGTSANRAANKEAMFVLAYNEANTGANYSTSNGNRLFKWTLCKYRERPGMANSYVSAYGVDNDTRMMPTWHLLDLFDESKDARYAANFQELWIANTAWPWLTKNLTDATKGYYEKEAHVKDSTIAVGDTAMFFTKKVWGGRTWRRYLETDRNELYDNPQPGKGAAIVNSTTITKSYPSFKKFVNVNRTASLTTDFGDALILRLSEMYLIAAEAYVGLGDAASAVPFINEIRGRAALPGQKATMLVSAADVNLNFILDERAREFVGESQRWYDLKRVFHDQNKWVEYIKNYNPDLTLIQPYHWLRPVPLAELNALSNAKEYGQNEGYPQPQ
jgi:starch-binding outer membrane protein, SusD/RagB family